MIRATKALYVFLAFAPFLLAAAPAPNRTANTADPVIVRIALTATEVHCMCEATMDGDGINGGTTGSAVGVALCQRFACWFTCGYWGWHSWGWGWIPYCEPKAEEDPCYTLTNIKSLSEFNAECTGVDPNCEQVEHPECEFAWECNIVHHPNPCLPTCTCWGCECCAQAGTYLSGTNVIPCAENGAPPNDAYVGPSLYCWNDPGGGWGAGYIRRGWVAHCGSCQVFPN